MEIEGRTGTLEEDSRAESLGIPAPRQGEPEAPPGSSSDPDDMQERKARAWALATRHNPGSEIFLMRGKCAVCCWSIHRQAVYDVKLEFLIITPWQHHFVTKHPAVLADPSERTE